MDSGITTCAAVWAGDGQRGEAKRRETDAVGDAAGDAAADAVGVDAVGDAAAAGVMSLSSVEI